MSVRRLVDLNPWWVGNGGKGVTDAEGQPVPHRPAIGLGFDCPCGCGAGIFVAFRNPPDGGPQLRGAGPAWTRTGDSFETMTLEPSILVTTPGGCGWHGWVRNGEVLTC